MFKVISDINIICYFKFEQKMICAFMFIISNHFGIKCLSNVIQLEPCNVIIKVTSYKMAHWYDLWNTIVITINICKAMKMICSLVFIINNHFGIQCLSNLLQLETCNVMFKVISDIKARWFHLWNTIVIAVNLCNARKWCVHWCFSNNGIKCLSNLVQLQLYNTMFLKWFLT